MEKNKERKMTKEVFIERLKKIKEMEKTLYEYHTLIVEHNPFIEDGSGVIPTWLSDFVKEHVVTLFASVNEAALHKTRLDSCMEYYKGKSIEEIAEEIGMSVEKLKKTNPRNFFFSGLLTQVTIPS